LKVTKQKGPAVRRQGGLGWVIAEHLIPCQLQTGRNWPFFFDLAVFFLI
jgi:hypothetical protein